MSRLVARFHDPAIPGGRPHRLIVAAHLLPEDDPTNLDPEEVP